MWGVEAGAFTCGARITWKMSTSGGGLSLPEAKRSVGREQSVCAKCAAAPPPVPPPAAHTATPATTAAAVRAGGWLLRANQPPPQWCAAPLVTGLRQDEAFSGLQGVYVALQGVFAGGMPVWFRDSSQRITPEAYDAQAMGDIGGGGGGSGGDIGSATYLYYHHTFRSWVLGTKIMQRADVAADGSSVGDLSTDGGYQLVLRESSVGSAVGGTYRSVPPLGGRRAQPSLVRSAGAFFFSSAGSLDRAVATQSGLRGPPSQVGFDPPPRWVAFDSRAKLARRFHVDCHTTDTAARIAAAMRTAFTPPTPAPTKAPSPRPTMPPTPWPTLVPTQAPTESPTPVPTRTAAPTPGALVALLVARSTVRGVLCTKLGIQPGRGADDDGRGVQGGVRFGNAVAAAVPGMFSDADVTVNGCTDRHGAAGSSAFAFGESGSAHVRFSLALSAAFCDAGGGFTHALCTDPGRARHALTAPAFALVLGTNLGLSSAPMQRVNITSVVAHWLRPLPTTTTAAPPAPAAAAARQAVVANPVAQQQQQLSSVRMPEHGALPAVGRGAIAADILHVLLPAVVLLGLLCAYSYTSRGCSSGTDAAAGVSPHVVAEEGKRLLPLQLQAGAINGDTVAPPADPTPSSAGGDACSDGENEDDDDNDAWLKGTAPWRNQRGEGSLRGGAAHLASTYEFAYDCGDEDGGNGTAPS